MLPAIKVLKGPSPTQTALADASTSGLSTVLSSGSDAVDLIPHDGEELQIFLNNRVAIASAAKDRASYVFGRLYNRFSGDDPDYIELSGTHLKQTLTVIQRPIPDVIVNAGHYKLRADIVRDALERLRGNA